MSTTINVVGTIATEPRMIHSANGTVLCSFRVASDERRYDREKQSWVEGTTNWFGVVCFRSLATHAHKSFHTGDRIIVSGKLKVRKWEKEGKSGTSVEIEADAIGHDLRWGTSRFEKLVGAQAQTVDESAPVPTSATITSAASQPPQIQSSEQMSEDGFTPQSVAA